MLDNNHDSLVLASTALLEKQSMNPMDHEFVFIESTQALLETLQRLLTAEKVAMDTETEVISKGEMDRGEVGRWCVTSIAARFADGTEELYVVDMSKIQIPLVAQAWSKITSLAWQANFETRVFESNGVYVKKWIDLMLCQAVLDTGALVGHVWYTGLAEAARTRLGIAMEGKKTIQLSYLYASPLSEEQKAYAAQDALITLWLEGPIMADLERAGLMETAMRECDAQHFINSMNVRGLPFDVDGWRGFLAQTQQESDEAYAQLADLTGGCEITLFGPTGKPTWKPNSKADLANALNTYAANEVRQYFATWGDKKVKKTTFDKNDVIDKPVLQLVGGPITAALLKARAGEKLISTYGEEMIKLLGPDDRFHSVYNQCLTATGRLSSNKPNAQNLPPKSKRFMKPHEESRAFILADFSQAELRLLAQVTGDVAMIQAFSEGKDLHVATAARMFVVDMDELEKVDKNEFKALRAKAKTLNFGIVYGLGATRLARNLSIAGIPTTVNEAKELLARYLEIYPHVAKWLEDRDQFVKNLSENPGDVDFDATWKLFEQHSLFADAKKKLLAEEVPVSDEAVAREVLGPRAQDTALLEETIRDAHWALSFDAPLVLKNATEPWSFESRTPGGRRRLFVVATREWITSMMLTAATSKKDEPVLVVQRWAENNGTELTKNGRPLQRDTLKKVFEKKGPTDTRLVDFVKYVLAEMPHAASHLMRAGLSDCIRAKKNQYRNHPIQGGVGDAVLEAFAQLDVRLKEFNNAFGVQSVHDSIVVECELAEAARVAAMVESTMKEAMTHYVYDLPVKVDADIVTSLDSETDKVTDEKLEEFFAEIFQEV